jgi:hypothetical protein
MDENCRREWYGKDICQLICRRDGLNFNDAWLEMLAKPVIFDCDALGPWSHLGWIGSGQRETSSVVLIDGRLDG